MTATATHETLQAVLDGLMRRYRARVPDVSAIIGAMVDEGVIATPGEVENDHIAFRTMGVPHLGIASLEKVFLHYGYARRDAYDFPAKKLSAYWYSPPEPHFPRIFISELRVRELSAEAQRIVSSYTGEVTRDPVSALELNDAAQVDAFLHHALWRLPRYADYTRLAQESEYAAWVIYNRYYLNHFTVSVHNLPDGYNTVAQFNAFLERRGFTLNSAGGKAKTSPDGLLIQSSTVAEMIQAEFAGGETHAIPGSYVEFAERKPLPGLEGRREGFEAGNADKIFESTYLEQTGRRT